MKRSLRLDVFLYFHTHVLAVVPMHEQRRTAQSGWVSEVFMIPAVLTMLHLRQTSQRSYGSPINRHGCRDLSVCAIDSAIHEAEHHMFDQSRNPPLTHLP